MSEFLDLTIDDIELLSWRDRDIFIKTLRCQDTEVGDDHEEQLHAASAQLALKKDSDPTKQKNPPFHFTYAIELFGYIAQIGCIRGKKNTRGNEPIRTLPMAWKLLTEAHNLPYEWSFKVKDNYYPGLVRRALEVVLFSSDPKIKNFYAGITKINVAAAGNLNQQLKSVYIEVEKLRQLEIAHQQITQQKQRIKQLELEVTEGLARIKAREIEIEKLKTGVIASNLKDWKITAIELRKQGVSVNDIAKTVGKNRPYVSTYLNQNKALWHNDTEKS